MRSFLSTSAAAGLASLSLASATLVESNSFPTVELAGVKRPVPDREYALNSHIHEFKRTASQPRRKTLGFGTHLPHAKYHSTPYQVQTNSFKSMSPDTDPFVVAERFIEDVLADKSKGSYGYWIRPDSYTDRTTGITHVFVGQSFQGFAVNNAHMNLNIKNGVVLSYGNSFYNGREDIESQQFSAKLPHRDYCGGLASELVKAAKLDQSFTVQDSETLSLEDSLDDESLAGAFNLYADNCLDGSSLYPFWFKPEVQHAQFDPKDWIRPALSVFMLSAAPDTSLRDMIAANLDAYMDRMIVSSAGHFASPNGHSEEQVLLDNVAGAISPVKATLGFHQVPTDNGEVTLVRAFKFIVEMQDNWYEAYVAASAPHHILSVTDWASDSPIPPPKAPEERTQATYNVFKWGINDPLEGNRTIVTENDDVYASPVGWHALPYEKDPSFKGSVASAPGFWRNTTTTWGNNVFAQENWEGQSRYIDNDRPDAGSKRVFNYTYHPKKTERGDAESEAHGYINATVAQLFYTCNLVHDIFYRYGFTEEAGNFQQYNFGRGGREGDGVIANAQDGSGYNNANFMTPPDGSNGRMRMYLWNTALPYRDGDLEAGIVIHEYSHGISTRLTGGPLNSNCLGWGESGGMGEGWGDFFATSIRSNKVYSDYAMGAWAANTENGIRNYVYSTNETINPSTYKTLDKPGYWGVHAIGEVWAQILWVVSQGMIKKHGFSDTLYPPAAFENGTVSDPDGTFYKKVGDKLVPKHGNSLTVQLVVNGMKLQPCSPTFFDARDAIIEADQELTGGDNFCTLWEGFSSRGLGPDARVDGRTPWGGGIRTNDYALPSQCKSSKVVA